MPVFWGVDAGGYSGGTTAVAGVEQRGAELIAKVYRRHAFAMVHHGWADAAEVLADERALLERLRKSGPVYIDVPLDLQDLGRATSSPQYLWGNQKRPVDQALGGLAPLASFLGAPVSRFRTILGDELDVLLGRDVFETYPRASLRFLLDESLPSYAGRAQYGASGWDTSKLGQRCQELGLVATRSVDGFTDHELDAILCAVAGVHPMSDTALLELVREEACVADASLPAGYRIAGPGRPWDRIVISIEDEM